MDTAPLMLVEERHLLIHIRIAVCAERLHLSDEGTIVDQRLIHLVGRAVLPKRHTLRMPEVFVVGTHLEPVGYRHIDACRHHQVHQVVLVAQVLVFGIVGSGEVHLHTQRHLFINPATDGSRQSICIQMFVAGIRQRVFHDVKRHSGRIDKGRTREVFHRLVAVGDFTKHHNVGRQSVERFHTCCYRQRLRCLIVVGEVALVVLQRQRCLRQMTDGQALQACCILAGQPGIRLFEKCIIPVQQAVGW